jgi:N-acyl-D-aspartate/D-glutamate deacylase
MMKDTTVFTSPSETNQKYLGRHLTEIAAEEGKSWIDVMMDIALHDNLDTEFAIREGAHTDVNVVAELLNHPLIKMEGSDGGAHVSQIATSGDTTYFLQHFVRETGKIKLERAIQRITSEPALDYNIQRRGEIRLGNFADLVLMDLTKLQLMPRRWQHDLPGGGSRLLHDAKGISKVILNGQLVVDNNRYTDARAGRFV